MDEKLGSLIHLVADLALRNQTMDPIIRAPSPRRKKSHTSSFHAALLSPISQAQVSSDWNVPTLLNTPQLIC
jgi:hypothetical protein